MNLATFWSCFNLKKGKRLSFLACWDSQRVMKFCAAKKFNLYHERELASAILLLLVLFQMSTLQFFLLHLLTRAFLLLHFLFYSSLLWRGTKLPTPMTSCIASSAAGHSNSPPFPLQKLGISWSCSAWFLFKSKWQIGGAEAECQSPSCFNLHLSSAPPSCCLGNFWIWVFTALHNSGKHLLRNRLISQQCKELEIADNLILEWKVITC